MEKLMLIFKFEQVLYTYISDYQKPVKSYIKTLEQVI